MLGANFNDGAVEDCEGKKTAQQRIFLKRKTSRGSREGRRERREEARPQSDEASCSQFIKEKPFFLKKALQPRGVCTDGGVDSHLRS